MPWFASIPADSVVSDFLVCGDLQLDATDTLADAFSERVARNFALKMRTLVLDSMLNDFEQALIRNEAAGDLICGNIK